MHVGLLLLTIVMLGLTIAFSIWAVTGTVNDNNMYIVQVRSDHPDVDVSFRLAYFRSCVSAKGDPINSTACIAWQDYHDDKQDSLAMQYLEELGLASTQTTSASQSAENAQSSAYASVPQTVRDTVRDQLLILMPVMIDMSEWVFPGIPSAIFLGLFVVSGIGLISMSGVSFKSKIAKAFLTIGVITNGYSLTLGFMIAYATRQACQALLLQPQTQQIQTGSALYSPQSTTFNRTTEAVLIIGSTTDGLADSELFFVSDNWQLQAVQWAVAGLTCVFEIMLALLFVIRRAAIKAKARHHV